MNTSADPTLTEAGFPRPSASPPGELPAGGNTWGLPYYLQFSTFMNYVSRTYFWTHDEALRDSGTCNDEAMWSDLVISTAIRDRQRPVVQLEYQLEPRNPTDNAEKGLADILTQTLQDIPNFQQLKRCLLDAIWRGRAGVQLTFDWDFKLGEKRLIVRDWSPIHGDSLVFKFDGQPGILVNSTLANQPNVFPIEGRGGYAKFLTPEEEQRVLIHEFEPEPAEYFRPEKAGSVNGSGYRGRVYWYWWLKHNLHKIMFDYLRKAGNGFMLAGYESGNRTELAKLQQAIEEQAGQPIIYVPLGGKRMKLDEVLKVIPTNLSGADMMWTVINGLNGLIRQAIMGEMGTTSEVSSGLGSSIGDQHGMTADERVKYDAQDLETPLQKLVNVLAKYTNPKVRPPRFQHLADKRQPGEIMQAVQFAMQAGMVVPTKWVQEQLGIPEPINGEAVLGMVQGQQGTALDSAPADTPMVGQPGPIDPSQQGQEPGGTVSPSEQQGPDSQTAQLMNQIQPMGV